ncbi:MAG: hypothetical protein GX234_02055, partial [Clostridiales bacterium]|nr:hypothetical protein [Clostridiales bacterium]
AVLFRAIKGGDSLPQTKISAIIKVHLSLFSLPSFFIGHLTLSTISVYILFDSFMNLRQALDLKDAGYDKWWSMLILAVIMIILGIIMVFNPFGTVAVMVMFMGGIFLFRGISNIVSILFTNNKIKTLKKIRDLDD